MINAFIAFGSLTAIFHLADTVSSRFCCCCYFNHLSCVSFGWKRSFLVYNLPKSKLIQSASAGIVPERGSTSVQLIGSWRARHTWAKLLGKCNFACFQTSSNFPREPKASNLILLANNAPARHRTGWNTRHVHQNLLEHTNTKFVRENLIANNLTVLLCCWGYWLKRSNNKKADKSGWEKKPLCCLSQVVVMLQMACDEF